MNTPDEQAFQLQLERLGPLIQRLEKCPDPAVRADAQELVRTLLDLHGTGLAKMLALLAARGESSRLALEEFAADALVGSLLLLHGLHPVDLETRVRQALDKARLALRPPDGDVELLSITDGTVRLRLVGNWEGYPATIRTLQAILEEALCAAAPDVTAVEIDGLAPALAVSERARLISLPLIAAPGEQ